MPDVDELLGGAQDAMTVKRVYGDPVEGEGVTLVPGAVVIGGGGGGGDNEGNGGGGFGLGARPIGAWVIRDGDATWKPAVDMSVLAFWGFMLGLAFVLRRRR
jgi:uncharacterized spore protein YtfJ